MTKFSIIAFLREQFAAPVPLVTADLSGKIVMVTGSNTGVGFEAAKHFASMNPERLILACRNEAKGKKAVEDIKAATGHQNVELRLVDLARFESVNEFCDKVEKDVPRLDVLVANAGMLAWDSYIPTSDGWEQQLQVNHLANVQMSLLLLPLLRRTASLGSIPRLVLVSSDTHLWADLSAEAKSEREIIPSLNDKEYLTQKGMKMQYPRTKMLNILFTRELASKLPANSPLVVNCVTPCLCKTGLRREFPWPLSWIYVIVDATISWSAERGSRQLIFGALGYEEREDDLKGAYISSSKIVEPSDFIISDEGKAVQKRVWNETIYALFKVAPKLQSIVESLGV